MKPEAQEALRKRVVIAVEGGMGKSEASRVFGISREAIYKWIERFRESGERGLRRRKKGPVGRICLEAWQAAQVVRSISDRCPDQLKLPFALWSREAVQMLIERRFGIRLSVWTVGRYLRRWGLTPQKPVRRAYEQDPEAVRMWLEEEYPRIKMLAKAGKAEIYWGDETGVRSDYVAGRSYSKRGKTPVIPGTGKRFSCNMISAITNRGRLYFMVFKKNFRADVFLEFLRRLLRQVKRKIFLIIDSHPAHIAIKVKKWIEKNSDRIRVFYLPGYSPELNPDEMLNNDVKSNAAGRMRPFNCGEMMGNIRSYLRSTQKRPDIVKNYFNEESLRYAA